MVIYSNIHQLLGFPDMTIAETHQSHHSSMKHLCPLLEGPAKLHLWGVKVAAAGKGQQQRDRKKEEGGILSFLHSHKTVHQAFPGNVLREFKMQGFASQNQLHLMHMGAQLSWSPRKDMMLFQNKQTAFLRSYDNWCVLFLSNFGPVPAGPECLC